MVVKSLKFRSLTSPLQLLFLVFVLYFRSWIMRSQHNVPTWLQGSDCFTEEVKLKTAFSNGWKREKGLYTVGFTRRGLLGTASDAVKIAGHIGDQWRHDIKGTKNIRIIK